MPVKVVISLDFELGWGHRRLRPEYVRRIRDQGEAIGTRIKRLIDCFETYDIPATWAVVGSLIEDGDDPVYYRPDLFRYLLESGVEHEVGAHSYTHPDFTELSGDEVGVEISKSRSAIKEWGLSPQSFIYPLNRVSQPEVLTEYGFTHYRYDPVISRIQRIREYVSPTIRYSTTEDDEELITVPSSMFLAARHPTALREFRYRRLFHKGVKRSDGIIHFTLHPHNVVTDPDLFAFIEGLFQRLTELREANKVQCVPIRDCS